MIYGKKKKQQQTKLICRFFMFSYQNLEYFKISLLDLLNLKCAINMQMRVASVLVINLRSSIGIGALHYIFVAL